jgi:hypothetical protein
MLDVIMSLLLILYEKWFWGNYTNTVWNISGEITPIQYGTFLGKLHQYSMEHFWGNYTNAVWNITKGVVMSEAAGNSCACLARPVTLF